MGNIKKRLEELSDNAKHIVGQISVDIDGGYNPITIYDTDATVEEIIEAMKYVVNINWWSNILYARKVLSAWRNEYRPAVAFADKEQDLNYYQILDEFPEIIGMKNNGGVSIYLRTSNEILTYDMWKESHIQK